MDKTERQINLIALLMSSERPVSGARIREGLYADATSDESFKRMFERDKDDLRALGLRIEIAPIGVWDEGYTIHRDEAILPPLDLTPAEHAALMLASQAWGEGTLGPASPRAAGMKLSVTGDGDGPSPWILPHVDLRPPQLTAVFDALMRRKRVTFAYRSSGAAVPEERTVEPHGLRFRSAWYLTGLDIGRGELRVFKLDRIDGAVRIAAGSKPDFQAPPPAPVEWPAEAEAGLQARVAFTPEVAFLVEQRAGARRAGDRDDGRVDVLVAVPDEDRFVRWVLGFADDAEVIEPPSLRDVTIERLRAAAGKA
ncbi:MAG TPA: WYL domain-containing protein [Actinomycetota bacterium]|nr:WYL domain-containing protein [Actinomycetota bacterium]